MIIQQTQTSRFMTGEEYRALPQLNYSACRDFADSRLKFHRKWVMKVPSEDEDRDPSMIFGDLVHCLLLTPEDFDKRFAMVETSIVPTGQMKILADNLWEITKGSMSEKREVTRSMQSMIEEAFELTAHNKLGERVAFKGKTVKHVIDDFDKIEPYYESLKANFGKDVISMRIRENAEKVTDELQRNPITAPIVNMQDSKTRKVYREMPIFFTYEGHEMKAMIDQLVVDHDEKVIHIYDLKSVGFDFEYNIIKNRYYLQWSVYWQAVKSWAESHGLKDYVIIPMRFIVVCSDLRESPLIYTTSMDDLGYGLKGFKRNGRNYKGLNQILMEIAWHSSYNIWHISYQDYQNKGIKRVSLFEES